MDDAVLRAEIELILAAHGFSADELELGDGFSNLVFLTPDTVVRVNRGRFPDAFHHEAEVVSCLPSDIPHPTVLAVGYRENGGEYLIQRRVEGTNLKDAWLRFAPMQRRYLAARLGSLVRTMHELPLQPWMSNPWIDTAIASGNWRDAYHAPVECMVPMIADLTHQFPDSAELFARVLDHCGCPPCSEAHEQDVFIHGDLHFGNVIVHGGEIVALIDYEGSRPAPPETELDMFIRSTGWISGNSRMYRIEMLEGFRDGYPQLFSGPELVTRLERYEALWHLVQMYHWTPGDPWIEDPFAALERVLDGAFAAEVTDILR